MKYMGSKARIAKHILPIILEDRKPNQWYVEPFVGGANIIDKVNGNRIGADSNKYIIAMWKEIQSGWEPSVIDKNFYGEVKGSKDDFAPALVGWVGVACSYSGKWFGGFAGKVDTKGGVRDYQAEAHLNLKKQAPLLSCVNFIESDYKSLNIPKDSIIYCDPPYEGTTGYKDKFNHEDFWQWCRDKCSEGHSVFISEYNAPDDFISVWSANLKSSLSANGKAGGSKSSVENLFIHKSQFKEKKS